VHGGDNLADRIGEQYRYTVRDQRHHGEPRLGRDQRITGWHRLHLRTIDHCDSLPVHLLHPDQLLHGKADTGGKPLTIGSHCLRTITDMLAQVE
jgi:hypothetical protein